MKTNIFVVAAFLFASVSVFAQKKTKDKVLANKTFTIEITDNKAKKPKPEADEISFKGEKLSSKFLTAEYKYTPSPYTVTVDSSSTPHIISFTVECRTQGGEVIEWNGTVKEESIEGTAVVTSKKGKVLSDYSFAGELKAKPGKKK